MSTNVRRQIRGSKFLPRHLAMAGVFRLPPRQISNPDIRNDMRSQVWIFCLLLMLSASVAAQQKPSTGIAAKSSSPAKAHTAASNSSSSMSANLPTEEEVNAFLQAQIGWEPQTTWKIVSIKPSKAAGLLEASVQISGAQQQSGQTFFVIADGRHALFLDICPFRKHPFEQTRLELHQEP